MTSFFANINRKALTGRLLISIACSVIGLVVLTLLIGLRITGNFEEAFNDYLPYLLILHFPFWVISVFVVNELLRKRFGGIADVIAGRRVTLMLLLLMTACLFISADNSLMLAAMEILCGVLSLNLTLSHEEKTDAESVLQDWSFADAKILRFLPDFDKKRLSVLFQTAYHLPSKRHIYSVWFVIYEWEDLEISVFEGNDKGTKKIDFGTFDLIQLTTLLQNRLILEGFSKESGGWLTYEFSGSKYKIKGPTL